MKNQNQAEVKASKRQPLAPSKKSQDHAPLPTAASRWSPMTVLASEPLAGRDGFEIELDWIGDTMEPEVCQGNLARVWKREDMGPCLGELVLGLLKNGLLVFGAFGTPEDDERIRVTFINPKYPSVYYRESDFQWLYPVESISQLAEDGCRRIIKTIEFEAGDDVPDQAFRTGIMKTLNFDL